MLDKIKKAFEKSEMGKKKEFGSFVLSIGIGAVIGFYLYYRTSSMPLFLGAVMIGLICPFIFSGNLSENKEIKSIRKEALFYISFYDMFYHYSALTTSYKDGLSLASENLEICPLKDHLTDYFENNEETLPLKLTNSRAENNLLDLMQRYLHSEEYVSPEDLKSLQSHIETYKEELKGEQDSVPIYLAFSLFVIYFVALLSLFI